MRAVRLSVTARTNAIRAQEAPLSDQREGHQGPGCALEAWVPPTGLLGTPVIAHQGPEYATLSRYALGREWASLFCVQSCNASVHPCTRVYMEIYESV